MHDQEQTAFDKRYRAEYMNAVDATYRELIGRVTNPPMENPEKSYTGRRMSLRGSTPMPWRIE